MLKRDVHFLPMLALGTAGCLWGTRFYFGKIALSEMPVATMVLFRFVFACAGLLPVIFFNRPHFAGTEWGWVLAASLLGVPVQYLVQFKGLSLTTVFTCLSDGRHTPHAPRHSSRNVLRGNDCTPGDGWRLSPRPLALR
jgi:hypothetical protein